jgi:hypothetical protein
MYFKNCLPIFKLLEDYYVIFLSHMHRYMFSSCCELEDHAPNRKEPEFEAELAWPSVGATIKTSSSRQVSGR